LNNPADDRGNWEEMSFEGYGKFGNDSYTPLQIWEPDTQSEII